MASEVNALTLETDRDTKKYMTMRHIIQSPRLGNEDRTFGSASFD